jgi:hypothetical protein
MEDEDEEAELELEDEGAEVELGDNLTLRSQSTWNSLERGLGRFRWRRKTSPKECKSLRGQGRKYLEAAGYSEFVFGTHRLWPAYTFTQRKTEILWEPRRILKGIIFSWRITWASFHPFSGSQRNFQKEGHFEFESIGMENLS